MSSAPGTTRTEAAPPWRTALVAVGAAGLFGLTYGPLLWEFAGNLWSRPYYQHFPYVLLASAVLIYEQLKSAPAAPRTRRPWLQGTLLTSAWLVLVLAVVAMSPLLAAASAILLTGGLLAAYCRHAGVRFPAAPWMLLWLVIPPPVGLDQRLLARLQLISSDLASKALDLLGVGHLMEGNTLILPTKQLFVDEACSGIVSVISLSTCAAIYAVWQRRPLVHIALLMAAAVGWAVLLNVVRIVTIALAEAHAGVDLAEGVAHTLLGLGVFALNVLAVIALDWLLHALLSEIDTTQYVADDAPLHSGSRLIAFWNWLTTTDAAPAGGLPPHADHRAALAPALSWASLLAAAAFAVVGLGQLAVSQDAAAGATAQKLPVDQIVAALLEPGVLPDKIGELTLVNVEHVERERDDIQGEHSVVWEYRDASNRPLLLSCDLPFSGWHELSICYLGMGWILNDRTLNDTSGPAISAVEMDLARSDKGHAHVVFGAFYLDGESVSPPAEGRTLLARIRHSFQAGTRPRQYDENAQVQVLAVRSNQVGDEDRDASQRLLREASSKIVVLLRSMSENSERSP